MITIILICIFSQHSNLLSPDGRPMCLAGILEGTGDRPNARSPQGWQHHDFFDLVDMAKLVDICYIYHLAI